MVTKSKGFRWGTKLRLRKKGREGITRYVQDLPEGQKVIIAPNPTSHAGFPFPRFMGACGEVVERRGRAYKVRFKDKNAVKHIMVMPEHLKKA